MLSSPHCELVTGTRAANVFESKSTNGISCMAIELAPQASTPPEYNGGYSAVVQVVACEDELASFTLNGAKVELRSGDHLNIPTGTKFHFVNSSFTVPLKLRIVRKLRDRSSSDTEDEIQPAPIAQVADN